MARPMRVVGRLCFAMKRMALYRRSMRLGYFGGTFDPPHRGHLRAALLAADVLRLDRVLMAPTGRQPLKEAGASASFEDRLAMTRLLCAADPRLEATELDAPHRDGSPNYTVDLLGELAAANPGTPIFSIIGADSFLHLPFWREPERLFALAEWIVVSRPEFPLEHLERLNLTDGQRDRVHLIMTLDDDTSATELRERLQAGVSPGDRLTPEVLLYISRMRLYHSAR